jgi:hypothetical protein
MVHKKNCAKTKLYQTGEVGGTVGSVSSPNENIKKVVMVLKKRTRMESRLASTPKSRKTENINQQTKRRKTEDIEKIEKRPEKGNSLQNS